MRSLAIYGVLIGLLWVTAVAQMPSQPRTDTTDVPITFATASHVTINGILCMPSARAGRLPAAVLVTSAGFPGDNRSQRESTFYTELARGLATVGIASMRYGNSETSVPAGLKVIPPDLQIANGAGALEYTAARPEMNPNAVFVLGYDAGARLVPWIAARYPGTRGMILMGADMLPAEQVLATRTRRELEQQGKSEHDIVQELASQNQLLADIRDGKVPSSRMIYGAPASYWLEWMSRNPLAELRNTRIPVLVVEGGSDREFSQEAYEKLQAALGAAATFRRIEGLNHEFAQVQPGTQVPAVDAKVIEFLRSWMVTHSSGEKKH